MNTVGLIDTAKRLLGDDKGLLAMEGTSLKRNMILTGLACPDQADLGTFVEAIEAASA